MKKVLLTATIFILFASTVFAGSITRENGDILKFSSETEFVQTLLETYPVDTGNGKIYFFLIDESPSLEVARIICTKPESLDLEEDNVSLYSSFKEALASQEYVYSMANYLSPSIYLVEVEVENRDMIAVYDLEKKKIAETRDRGFRDLR